MSNYLAIPNVPRWIKVTKTYSDFATAGLTNTLTLYTLGSNEVLHSIAYNVPTTFSGGTIATYTIVVKCGSVNAGAVTDVKTATISKRVQPPSYLVADNYIAGSAITATAVSTVGNLNAATQGSMDVWLLVSTLPD